MFSVVIHPHRRHLRAAVLHERAKVSKSLLFEQIQILFRNHFVHRSPPRKITRKSFAQRGPSRSFATLTLHRASAGHRSAANLARASRFARNFASTPLSPTHRPVSVPLTSCSS